MPRGAEGGTTPRARSHLFQGFGHFREGGAICLEPREQIVNEGQEEGHVLRHKLGHVHVTQRTHHEEHLCARVYGMCV